MHRIEKTKLLCNRLNKHDEKIRGKKKKIKENLNIVEKVLVLAERIKKKLAPGKFYKQSVENIEKRHFP